MDKLHHEPDPEVTALFDEMGKMKKEGTLAQKQSTENPRDKISTISEESKIPASTVSKLDVTAIKELSALCKKFLTLEGNIKKVAERLNRLQNQQSQLSELILPEQLAQLGYIRGVD